MESKLLPWQQRMLAMMASKDRTVLNVARQSGKTSTFQQVGRYLEDVMNKRFYHLLIGTGTVFGEEYYSVEPVGGDWSAVMEWCHKTYGDHSDPREEAGGRWYTESRKIWFRQQKDRDWFVLRWG